MNPNASAREARIASTVAAVVRQALLDAGVGRVALLDDGSPEAGFAARILHSALGGEAVVRVTTEGADAKMPFPEAGGPPDTLQAEIRRFRARLLPDALVAAADNKTALLLDGPLPPEPLLPLGDLYASEVAALAGDWSASAEVRGLAEACGGIAALDAALRARIDGRAPDALRALPPGMAEAVERALHRGRSSRLFPRIVPKIGARTLGVDLFE